MTAIRMRFRAMASFKDAPVPSRAKHPHERSTPRYTFIPNAIVNDINRVKQTNALLRTHKPKMRKVPAKTSIHGTDIAKATFKD